MSCEFRHLEITEKMLIKHIVCLQTKGSEPLIILTSSPSPPKNSASHIFRLSFLQAREKLGKKNLNQIYGREKQVGFQLFGGLGIFVPSFPSCLFFCCCFKVKIHRTHCFKVKIHRTHQFYRKSLNSPAAKSADEKENISLKKIQTGSFQPMSTSQFMLFH